jgi:hypothetical protein
VEASVTFDISMFTPDVDDGSADTWYDMDEVLTRGRQAYRLRPVVIAGSSSSSDSIRQSFVVAMPRLIEADRFTLEIHRPSRNSVEDSLGRDMHLRSLEV